MWNCTTYLWQLQQSERNQQIKAVIQIVNVVKITSAININILSTTDIQLLAFVNLHRLIERSHSFTCVTIETGTKTFFQFECNNRCNSTWKMNRGAGL